MKAKPTSSTACTADTRSSETVTTANRSSRAPMSSAAIDEMAPSTEAVIGAQATWIGRCIQDRHPAVPNRIQVRVETPEGGNTDLWIPTLQGLPVRIGDHIMLARPGNWSEPIALGVVDGVLAPAPPVKRVGARLELKNDEALVIASQAGDPLVEVRASPAGPVVRIMNDDVNLELDGSLNVRARSVTLAASRGEARIEAHGDVVVKGETIQLN